MVHPGLALGGPALGAHPDPFKFPLQGFLPGGLLFTLVGQPVLLLFQPGGVVPLPGDAFPPVQLEDPARDIVQKVAVVGYSDYGSLVFMQMVLKPGDGFRIQMVCRLVKQKYIGLPQKQAAQSDPALLSPRQGSHLLVRRRTAQGVHGHLQPGIQVPGVTGIQKLLDLPLPFKELVHLFVAHLFGKAGIYLVIFLQKINGLLYSLFNHLADSPFRIEPGFLFQIPDGIAGGKHSLTVKILVHSGHDLQQGTFSRTVQPQNTDLGAVEIGEGYILRGSAFY